MATKEWHIHSVAYYSATKIDELLINIITSIDLISFIFGQ